MKRNMAKLVFLLNHMLVLVYLCTFANSDAGISIHSIVPITLATLFLLDISYMMACDVTGNRILILFCALLALDSWYLLLSFRETPLETILFQLLSPVILYVSVQFVLFFLFQGYRYQLKKGVDILLFIVFVSAAISTFLSGRIFAVCYGIQFVVSIPAFLFVAGYHHKRIGYVIRSERRALLFSAGITAIGFLIYYFFTRDIKDHIGNFGIYLTVLVFSFSIHGIAVKESQGMPIVAVLERKQGGLLAAVCLGFLCLVSFAFHLPVLLFIMECNFLFCVIFLSNIFLGENLRQKKDITANDSYTFALEKLRREEHLKAEFSDFLHDDILQDLLSIKNMTGKSHRPEVQDLICKTLENLNVRIRERMQDYHPVILKNLTVKENYGQLIRSVQETFPQKRITVLFECAPDIFIAEPYDMLVYRLIKELLTNVYKHSNGDSAVVTLVLVKDIIRLAVSDNGTKEISSEDIQSAVSQKGILSLKEQTDHLGGFMYVKKNQPCGLRIEVELPMRGEGSYQHFVS